MNTNRSFIKGWDKAMTLGLLECCVSTGFLEHFAQLRQSLNCVN